MPFNLAFSSRHRKRKTEHACARCRLYIGEHKSARPDGARFPIFFRLALIRSRSYRERRPRASFPHRETKTLPVEFLLARRHSPRYKKITYSSRVVSIVESAEIRACGIYLKFYVSTRRLRTPHIKAVRLREGAFPRVDSFSLNNFKS